MFIIGLGTATPPRCYRQSEGWTVAQAAPEFAQLTSRSRAILKKVLLGENGIETRYLALESLSEAFQLHPDALHARFVEHAPALGTDAAERALHNARTERTQIDALIVSTCTGYLCPGLTSYISERLGLRSDIIALDLVGQGCGATLPNLRTAEHLLKSERCKRVLSISVEICSAAFYLDNDPGVLISACLFGDGAGAAVLSNEPSAHQRRVEWKNPLSMIHPGDRDLLRFEQKNGMLRNILDRQVPALAAQHVGDLLNRMLAQNGLSQDQINGWILHAGGREVLVALRDRFNVSDHDLRWSAAVLRRLGNVSSPCVLFVLQEALSQSPPGGLWWMSSFGAGFSCHGAFLDVEH